MGGTPAQSRSRARDHGDSWTERSCSRRATNRAPCPRGRGRRQPRRAARTERPAHPVTRTSEQARPRSRKSRRSVAFACLPAKSECSRRNSRKVLVVCEGHCRHGGVAGTLWREDALNDRDLVDHELQAWGGEALESRRDRLALGAGRIFADACKREMGRERAVVESELSAPQAGGEACAEQEHARPAVGDRDPDDARASAFRESTGALECQPEPGYLPRSLPRGAGDLVEPLIRGPAEE